MTTRRFLAPLLLALLLAAGCARSTDKAAAPAAAPPAAERSASLLTPHRCTDAPAPAPEAAPVYECTGDAE